MDKLIIYFSVGGVTRRMVEYMGDQSKIEIRPKQSYTDADILSVNPKSRVNVEQEQKDLRPEIENIERATDLLAAHKFLGFTAQSDIYLGFPLWNLKAPRIIFTALDKCKDLFSLNTIHVFCTSGGSPINEIERELKETYPQLHWGKFKQFSYTTTKEEVQAWIQ